MTHSASFEDMTDKQLLDKEDRLVQVREGQLRAEGNAWTREQETRDSTLATLRAVRAELKKRGFTPF